MNHIRPLDTGHDMPSVLDLIELGFRDELDPPGWRMLRQMRQLYQPGALARLAYSVGIETAGFVWVEDDQIVGNLSLRYASPRSSRGRLIGNVVVHKDHRGRGIGRALMENAIKAARGQDALWIGLEVRADNIVACQLYQHLGFRTVGTAEHMIRPDGVRWPDAARSPRGWRRSRSEDSVQWHRLATLIHGRDQGLVLEVRPDLYEFGGLERWVNRWLNRQRNEAWVHTDQQNCVDLATHIQTDRRHHYHVWDVLMHPSLGSDEAQELLARCLATTRRFPPWAVVTIVADQPALMEELCRSGFQKHRTLQQMILEL